MTRGMAREACAAASADSARVVDLRAPDGYAAGRVPGVRPTPLRTVRARCGEPPAGRPVYVIRADGDRGGTAAGRMDARGPDARSVAGGTRSRARADRIDVAGPREHAA